MRLDHNTTCNVRHGQAATLLLLLSLLLLLLLLLYYSGTTGATSATGTWSCGTSSVLWY